MKSGIIRVIRAYQRIVSPDQGFFRFLFLKPTCTMYPSCSDYTIGAVEKYGVFRGLFKGIRRILRCHPFQKKLIDVP